MLLIFALISMTFGISFICWIDDKKSHLNRVLRAWEVQISDFEVFQGNAAIYLRCGGQRNFGFVENLLLFAAVKEFCKSIKNWQSYRYG